MSLGPDPAQQQPDEEQFLSTFFCRALFDYQTDNDSSLSFHKDDIIEVLTRLESGWWDGLLGQERGWFPSNYVTVISDQEADAALAAAEAAAVTQLEFQNAQATVGHAHNFGLAHMQNVVASQEWDQQKPHGSLQAHSQTLSHSHNVQPGTNNVARPQQGSTAAGIGSRGDGSYPRSGGQSSDFWVPQVSADGRVSIPAPRYNTAFFAFHPLATPFSFMTYPHIQSVTYFVMGAYSWFLGVIFQIYYVNTQTGQQSRDLPLDVDQDISEGEVPLSSILTLAS